MLKAHLDNSPLDGLEREIITEAESIKGSGGQFANTVCIPWGALLPQERGLSANFPSAGGHLVGSKVVAAVDTLRPYSIAIQAGFNVQAGLNQNLFVPSGRTDEDRNGTWMCSATPSIALHTPRTGLATLTPHTWGQIIPFSGLFARQGAYADEFIRLRLLRAAGQAIDMAVLGNVPWVDGTAGRPVGLMECDGIQRYVVTTGAVWSEGLKPAQTYVAMRGGSDTAAAWIAGPTMRADLMSIHADAAANAVWQDDVVACRRAHCTSAMPTNAIAYGDFSSAVLGLFGGGIELEIDAFTGFRTNVVSMRALVTLDVAYPDPTAYAVVVAE
ncbi:phage major capsid protein [Roseateles sp.]|uniref:phage major capsid protein n=1 Tax=Roseateles sp. TaxID=1971397 RepID=UPI00286D0752|nr:phage major capsid protein [Roseateles sp.]